MRSTILKGTLTLLALATFGCAGAKVTQQSTAAPITATMPTVVVVYPFAVDTSDVSLNSSIFQVAYRNMSGEDQGCATTPARSPDCPEHLRPGCD